MIFIFVRFLVLVPQDQAFYILLFPKQQQNGRVLKEGLYSFLIPFSPFWGWEHTLCHSNWLRPAAAMTPHRNMGWGGGYAGTTVLDFPSRLLGPTGGSSPLNLAMS